MHFVVGFLASMSGQEEQVREGLGLGSLPQELRGMLDEQTKESLREAGHFYLQSHKRLSKDEEFVHNISKRQRPIHALDNTLVEGLLLIALSDARVLGWRPHLIRFVKLRALLTDVKGAEFLAEYAANRRTKISTVAETQNCSQQAFGYGSTFFSSVLRVVHSAQVVKKLEITHRIVIFGSSLGWQSCFLALMYGVQVDGHLMFPVSPF